MKNLLIILFIFSISYFSEAQQIPVIYIETNKFHQEFLNIENRDLGDNIIGKKIPLHHTFTKTDWEITRTGSEYLWQISFKSKPGIGLIIYFDDLQLPEGSSISAYCPDTEQKAGPFYKNFNILTNAFALPLIKNNQVVIEARVPLGQEENLIATISEIGCVPLNVKGIKGFGDTEPCFVNVNCPEGEPWSDQKRAVVRYTYTENGVIGNCTGTLVNNTAQDDRNFFLTAQHCAMNATDDELGQTIFYFNYESPNCDNPPNDDGLLDETVVGCSRIAASGDGNDPNGLPDGSDFHLFELNPIPESYNVYYAGWNRNDVDNLIGPGSIIQHPLSDIKKISKVSHFEQALSLSDVEAVIVTFPNGTGGNVEPNSSGSAMFDISKLVVGTISYGSQGCVTNGYNAGSGGKFYYHWDQNGTEANRQLAPWLDPLNTGVMTFDGKNSGNVGIIQESAHSDNCLKVYPNPSTGIFNVELLEDISTIIVRNLVGQIIYQIKDIKTMNYQLSLCDLHDGLYFLSVTTDKDKFYSKRVIIKK